MALILRFYDLINFARILDECEINQGYASYWNANIMTEFSDGKIEVWSYWLENRLEGIGSAMVVDNGTGVEYLNKWLQHKSRMSSKPGEHFFMIINNSYEDAFDGKYKDYIACEGRDRKLLIFDTYEDFSTISK